MNSGDTVQHFLTAASHASCDERHRQNWEKVQIVHKQRIPHAEVVKVELDVTGFQNGVVFMDTHPHQREKHLL